MNQPNNALRLSPGTTITLRGMTEADVPSGELTLVRDIAGRRPSSGPDSEGEQLQFMAFGGVCARREGQKREGRGRREGRQKGDGRGTSQEGGNVCVWRGWLLALGG
eukprot:272772-Rhodomonas_salina.3